MKKLIIITVTVLAFATAGNAQTVGISLDSVKVFRNDSVVMPVYVTNFTNIGAITLYIEFDTTNLSWGRTLSWSSSLNGNIPLVHHHHGTVGISWIDISGITITDGLLFELKFKHREGNSPVTISSNSELATPVGQILNTTFQSGVIWEGLTLQPKKIADTICTGASTTLNPMPVGGDGALIYNWASSEDPTFSSSLPTITVSPSVTTVYSVTVTDGIDIRDTSFHVYLHPNISPIAPINMLPADQATELYAPFTFSWAPSYHTTAYDIYLWKSDDPTPSTPWKSDIKQINYTHSSPLLYGQEYKWKVVAKNNCYSTSSIVQTFTTRALPNLNVVDVSTSQPVSGQPLTVTWTVKNNGAGPTVLSDNHTHWIDYVYLSPYLGIRLLDRDYELLGQFPNVSSLPAGDSYINTQTVQVPDNLMGPYFLIVITDYYGAWPVNIPAGVSPPIPYDPPPFFTAGGRGSRVKETVEDDNFFYKQLDFPVPPLADFITTNMVTPSTVFSGQQVPISFTVKNQGTNVTPANAHWFDKVWLSTDTVFNLATSVELASIRSDDPLEPDSSYTDTVIVTIPNNIYGTYYFWIQNDATNQVFENIGEDNNFRMSEPITIILTPPADIQVNSISVADSVSVRESVPITWTVINAGGVATPQSGHWDAIYISELDTFNIQQSTKLKEKKHNASVSVGGFYNVTDNVNIPDKIDGTYYLYVYTDSRDDVFEHLKEDNNTKRNDIPTIVSIPDLYPSNIIIPQTDSTGGNIPLSFDINNSGIGDYVEGKFQNAIFISSSSTWHPDSVTEIKTIQNSQAIPSGGSVTLNTTFKIPDGRPGPFYIFINVDNDDNVYESDKTNNIAVSNNSISIERPDLIVTSVNVPGMIVSGENSIISWTIKNDGGGYLVGKEFKDKIVMSRISTYIEDSTILVGTYKHDNLSLDPGDTIRKSVEFKIPHGYSGASWYFYVITDVDDQVYEKYGENNNISSASDEASMTLGPWADLTVFTINTPDTVTQGDLIPLSFTVINQGTKAATGHTWRDKVYISTDPYWNSSTVTNIAGQNFSSTLLPDSTYTTNMPITASMSWPEGFYYFYVFTDAKNVIYEYIDEGNNIKRSDPIYIKAYPPIDLATTATTAPTTANSGDEITVGWSVQNIGAGTTLAGFWFDGVYLSPSPVFNPSTAKLLTEKRRNGPLAYNQSYTTSAKVKIPQGTSGTNYIIVVADKMDVHYDVNRNNNAGTAHAIAITLTPSPDLVVTKLNAPHTVDAGQEVEIIYRVQNVGPGPTISGGWLDRFYISSDYVIDKNDVILGSKNFSGVLNSGEFYEDTVKFFVPHMPTGNYIMILKTDNNNVEYEHNAAHNNTLTSNIFINQLPPADLQVASITIPDTALAGEMITVSWEVINMGSNKANGYMKDNVYITKDTEWKLTDPLIGFAEGVIDLQPLNSMNRSLTFRVPGITPGSYHIMVRTDILNNIHETNDTNNHLASTNRLFIDLPELALGDIEHDTLVNMIDKHYRIIIPDSLIGESLITQLWGDSATGVNELYLRRNQTSTRINYDYSHTFPYLANQEVLVPTIDSGAYYLLAYGYNSAAPYQEISLLADILPFEIRNIVSNKGGNTGPVTIMLYGSKFDPNMTVYLDSQGVMIPAEYLHFVDITKSLVTFNLKDHNIGRYDLVAINSAGDSVRLEKAFDVIQGESSRLGLSILHPANSRPNRISAFSIEFGNIGNVDLVSPVIKLESMGGAPIAFETSGLLDKETELLIPLSLPGEPPGILRPGVSGSIVIYTISTHGLGFIVTRQ